MCLRMLRTPPDRGADAWYRTVFRFLRRSASPLEFLKDDGMASFLFFFLANGIALRQEVPPLIVPPTRGFVGASARYRVHWEGGLQ